MTDSCGYAHPSYAESLCEFGIPRRLPRCEGWILEREIPGTPYRDAIGPYPLFTCRNWSGLAADLDEIGTHLISLTLVPCPFDHHSLPLLEGCFTRVVPFKSHYVADLALAPQRFVKRSHRETVARAVKRVTVSYRPNALDYLDQWVDLFGVLAKRHRISGLRAFSREAFAKQLTIPGMVMFEAQAEGQTVGLDLWYEQGEVAYGHLVAFNELGYALRASYATKWFMLNYFRGKVKWVDLGGGAGMNTNGSDGLSVYKEGWSTGTRPVYLCCRIFDQSRYNELTESCHAIDTSYFPAYRSGNRL